MSSDREKLGAEQLRKKIYPDFAALLNKTEKLPAVHARSGSQLGKNDLLTRDISHRLDLAQKNKSSFEKIEVQLREILGIKEEKNRLPNDFEGLSQFLQKSKEELGEKLVKELERMKVNVLRHKEKFLGKVVREGGLLFRTQSGLLQPQMCRLYENAVKKARGSRDEVPKGDAELGAPSGRREAEILIAWLESMSETYLEGEELTLEEKVKRAQMIYTACFKEVVRQVSVSCVERGVLIQRIWNASIDLLRAREDLRVNQMQDLQSKVQNMIDTTIAELKSRCEKAENFISELKKRVEDEESESSEMSGGETVSIAFEREEFRSNTKRATILARKNTLKSIIEESEYKVNQTPVAPKKSIILFGYLDSDNVFHKQRIVHKALGKVYLNDYFDEVLNLAQGNDVGTLTGCEELESESIENENKERNILYYVSVSEQSTQFPESKPVLQVAKELDSRIFITAIKEYGGLGIIDEESKTVENEDEDDENENSGECLEAEDKGKVQNKPGKWLKGKIKIGLKKNPKAAKLIRKKNDFKINLNSNLIGEELKEENDSSKLENNSKSKSQIGGELPQDLRSVNRKSSNPAEIFQYSPVKDQKLRETSKKHKKTNPQLYQIDQNTERPVLDKNSEEEEEQQEDTETPAYQNLYYVSPEKLLQEDPEVQSDKIKSSERFSIYNSTPEITEKILKVDKVPASRKRISKDQEKADDIERLLSKTESLPITTHESLKISGKKDKNKSVSKRTSPLKSSSKQPKPLATQIKLSKNADSEPKPIKPDSESRISTLDKSCQVQIDAIPSEDLTRSQILSSIQQIKKNLQTFLSDSKKCETLFEDSRAIKRVKTLSTVLKTIFLASDQQSKTNSEPLQKSQTEIFDLLNKSKFMKNELEKIKNTQKPKTLVEEFNLGVVSRKIIITHPGQKMLNLVMQSIKPSAPIRATMSIKSLIKTINSVYTEKINMLKENSSYKKFETTMVLYDFLTNMYGLKTVAENKFKQVIISCLAYRENFPRVQNFSQFLGFDSSFVAEDWNFYLNIFDSLDYSNVGVNLGNELNHYSAIQSLSGCVRQFFDNKVSEQEIEGMLAQAEGLIDEEKELKGKNKNLRSDLVNTDKFLAVLMKFYYRFKERVYERLGVSVGREDFVNWEQFLEIVLKVCRKEVDVLEKAFEGHCVIKRDEDGGLNKLIRIESVLNIIFDQGLMGEII